MLVCDECGSTFEEPKVIVEKHGFDTPPFEVYKACPLCSGPCIAETFRCDYCREYVTSEYVAIGNGERFCSECFVVRCLFD
jgi:formylmethanofuran dehydrogenase subunit E